MNPIIRRYTPYILGGFTLSIPIYLYLANPRSKIKNETREIIRPIGYPAWITTLSPEMFKVESHWGPWGKSDLRTQTHLLLPLEECEKKLLANSSSSSSSSVKMQRKGGMGVKWDVASLGSNIPNEDRYAIDVLPKSYLNTLRIGAFWRTWGKVRNALWVKGKEEERILKRVEKGDEVDGLMMFSVIDGHGTNSAMSQLIAFPRPLWGNWEIRSKVEMSARSSTTPLNEDLLEVPKTILNALPTSQDRTTLLPNPSLVYAHLVELESSGVCLSHASIDLAADKMYIANVGDCRAVAGWWNPATSRWRCDIITEVGDCRADNPLEAERVRNAHPVDEKDDVICDDGDTFRVLGNIQLTRTLGDANTKRPIDDLKLFEESFKFDYYPHSRPYLTPPYVEAIPEVLERDLHPASGEQLKFLVLATDGLWDMVSSEEASLLMSAYLNDPTSGPESKKTLPSLHPYEPLKEPRPHPVGPSPGTTPRNSEGTWTFGDSNAAIHLIRNCLGPGDGFERQRLLSMKDNGSEYSEMITQSSVSSSMRPSLSNK